MHRRSTFVLATAASLSFAVAIIPTHQVIAQEKQHVSFKAPAEYSKYTQQLNVDVGDMPNHIVRVFEIHHTYPNDAPVINGLKLVESWERATGDRYDGNGDGTDYLVFVMENGDKFFARMSLAVQNVAGKLSATNVGHITGGTGKFAGIQGIVRGAANFNYATGFNENQTDIEYWFPK
jgi:hypothetical protein